ncbi:MAG TPA: PhzF family phenazine biosynthesis isomerase [Steroidobacteraceae bacterium]
MSSRVRIFQVDAFTSTPLTGNPAGVVPDADRLSAAQMQAIARELNNSDTAFLLRADAPDHDLKVRFFTPRAETGFVGHATVALHAVLASLGRSARRQQQSTGLVMVDVETGPPATVSVHLSPPPLQAILRAQAQAQILAALGMTAADLDERCPPQFAGSLGNRLLIGVQNGAVLARLTPDLPRLTELSTQCGASGYLLFTRQPSLSGVDTEARMFCPALGFAEDPVSGNAHAMLAVYLHARGLLPAAGDRALLRGAQGHHLGRPGRVRIELSLKDGQIESVRMSGHAVIVFEGILAC